MGGAAAAMPGPSACVRGPLGEQAFPQYELLHLARRREREFLEHGPVARRLVRHKVLAAVGGRGGVAPDGERRPEGRGPACCRPASRLAAAQHRGLLLQREDSEPKSWYTSSQSRSTFCMSGTTRSSRTTVATGLSDPISNGSAG